ncbi:MAG: M20/M25/M40 family metallo-hydrolase [Bryobacteraceae bacterium]|nr:M20/M25/M40 family metallo-hydrolase [Bryobacteraceae bacterium]
MAIVAGEGRRMESLLSNMQDLFALTRTLIDIESITPNEKAVGDFLHNRLSAIAACHNGLVERMPVEPDRDNILLTFDPPLVTLSTHMDTVPPFIASREDGHAIWGRGACDVKGIIAAMIFALERLLDEGERRVALLFVVGEERNSAGAYAAAKAGRGSKFLINGEPTENKLAVGTKGALRFEFHATGRMAHSAYPELGESAIDKLLDALAQVRAIPLENDDLLGPSTLNIGVVSGGRAPNVIPDFAKAELFVRLVDDGAATRERIHARVTGVEIREILCIGAVRLGTLPEFETMVAAYTTDIPAFGGAWGEPYLIGPGTIHVAHTEREHVPKDQLVQAVSIYENLSKQLLSRVN